MNNQYYMAGAILSGYLVWCLLKRKRDNPKTSYLMGVLNMALTPASLLRLGPFKYGHRINLEALMTEASKETGLSDFGNLDFLTHYKKIAQNPFYKSLKFSNLGNIVAQMEFMLVMRRKLRLIQYMKDVPSIKDIPVPAPVFIFGIGRSGTTYLHRLMALEPTARAPYLWELANPVPATVELAQMEADRVVRKEFMRNVIAKREKMGDKTLEGLHEIGHDLPEECLLFLSDHLPWSFHNIYSCLRDIPYFLKMMGLVDDNGKRQRSAQVVKAFQSYKRCLQLLSYQTGNIATGNNWMLKCPLHCYFIAEIMEVFPDAKLVWAHRHPTTNISSACSLLEGMHGTYYEANCLDRHDLANDVKRFTEIVLQQAPKDLAEHVPPTNCANVLFDELVHDPIGTVRGVYKQLNWEFTKEYEKILKEHVVQDKMKREAKKKSDGGKHGMYQHSPDRFGLENHDFTIGIYDEYINRYGLQECKM